MKTSTVRQLVKRHLRTDHMGKLLATRALRYEQRDGWVANFQPGSGDYDRDMVLVNQDHPVATIYRIIQHGEEGIGKGVQFPRVMVEQCIGDLLSERPAGDLLTRYGLALIEVDTNVVRLAGMNRGLAGIINASRYGTSRRGHDSTLLVQQSLGLPQRPRRLRIESRYQAALMIDGYRIDVNELIDEKPSAHLYSRWLIDSMAPAALAS